MVSFRKRRVAIERMASRLQVFSRQHGLEYEGIGSEKCNGCSSSSYKSSIELFLKPLNSIDVHCAFKNKISYNEE